MLILLTLQSPLWVKDFNQQTYYISYKKFYPNHSLFTNLELPEMARNLIRFDFFITQSAPGEIIIINGEQWILHENRRAHENHFFAFSFWYYQDFNKSGKRFKDPIHPKLLAIYIQKCVQITAKATSKECKRISYCIKCQTKKVNILVFLQSFFSSFLE